MIQQIRKNISKPEKNYAVLLHLSQILGSFLGGVGSILLPLILWLIKKDESSFIDKHGKEVVNFQLSLYIYLIIIYLLGFLTLGLLLIIFIPIIILAQILIVIFSIIGAMKASNGDFYTYPLNLRLIK